MRMIRDFLTIWRFRHAHRGERPETTPPHPDGVRRNDPPAGPRLLVRDGDRLEQ